MTGTIAGMAYIDRDKRRRVKNLVWLGLLALVTAFVCYLALNR